MRASCDGTSVPNAADQQKMLNECGLKVIFPFCFLPNTRSEGTTTVAKYCNFIVIMIPVVMQTFEELTAKAVPGDIRLGRPLQLSSVDSELPFAWLPL